MTLWDAGKLVERFEVDIHGPFKEEFLALRDKHLGKPEETPGVFNHPSIVKFFDVESNDSTVTITLAELAAPLEYWAEEGYIEQESLDELLAGTAVFSPYRDQDWGTKYPMNVMLSVLIEKGVLPMPEHDLVFNVWW